LIAAAADIPHTWLLLPLDPPVADQEKVVHRRPTPARQFVKEASIVAVSCGVELFTEIALELESTIENSAISRSIRSSEGTSSWESEPGRTRLNFVSGRRAGIGWVATSAPRHADAATLLSRSMNIEQAVPELRGAHDRWLRSLCHAAGGFGVEARLSSRVRAFVVTVGSGEPVTQQVCANSLSLRVLSPTGRAGRFSAYGRSLQLADLPTPDAAFATALSRTVARAKIGHLDSGRYPVVFAAGAAGDIVHEVIGHALEADTAGRGSALWRQRGSSFAPLGLHVADSPNSDAAWCQADADDEGTPTATARLVVDGVVVGMLTDIATSSQFRTRRTGHARRQSYRTPPLPRMAHTTVEPGSALTADLLSASEGGILISEIAAADADPSRGGYTLRIASAHRIGGGKAGEPLGSMTIQGDLSDFRSLDGIGVTTEARHSWCGKRSQWQPVSYSAPALRFGRLQVYA
jgi:predicted Zn-dependent protease